MKRIKNTALLAVLCIAMFGFSGCGKWSSTQGPGTLWIYEGDNIRKVEVINVHFLTSRTTRFTTSDGKTQEVQAPVYFASLK